HRTASWHPSEGRSRSGAGSGAVHTPGLIPQVHNESDAAARWHEPPAACVCVYCERKQSVMPFTSLGLAPELVRAVADEGYEQPTPIQQEAIPLALARGTDIVVATPGRLLDHMERGHVDFSRLEVLVLDEADRMLDMGFAPDVRRILRALPAKRQTMLFSATVSLEVDALARRALD